MTSSGRFRRWRWIALAVQALVVVGLPFVRIGGESALRLDVPAGRLHAFGASFAVDEAFVVLAATLLAAAAFLLGTLLLGRAWCGWACPQTVLGDLTSLVEPGPGRRRSRWRRPAGLALAAAVSALASANLLWYLVEPREFRRRLATGSLGPVVAWSWAFTGAVLFLDLAFLRARFCATVCPYAKLQGVLFDRETLVVAYDARRAADCVECGACVRVCPTGIDIRDGLQMECIACAACIDACEPIMAKLGRPRNLVGYFFGEPGQRPRLLRPASAALAAATAASLALLVAVVAARAVVSVVAVPEEAFSPRRTADGRVLNAWRVDLENHGREPVAVALALRVTGTASEAVLRPDRVELSGGERRQVRLLAEVRGVGPGRVPAAIASDVRSSGRVVERRATDVSLLVPEAR